MNRCVCVKPEFIDGHICYKLRNSLGGYGGIRVVKVSDDLGDSSSHGRGAVVAKSAVVTAGDVFRGVLMAVACSILPPFCSISPSADLHCLNSYPLDQVGSGKFFRGKIYDWLKKGYFVKRRILFIVSAAAIRLTFGRMLPFSSHVCVFWMKSKIGRDLNPAI